VALTAAASTIETEDGPGAAPGGTRVRRVRTVATSLAPALAIVLVQQVVFPAPGGIVLRGVIVGGLTALIALGMALVHRANRIINFAQADLGFAPAVLAYLLLDEVGVPWPLAVVAGLATAVVLGAATEVLVIRRFARAPRLLVTIATIGLSQVLTAVALLLPRLWDRRLVSDRIAPPWDATARLGGVVFDANDLLALVVTPVVVVGVAGLLRGSAAGVAIRASADDGDRASLLGIPVHRLHTIVWAGAAALAFVTVFLRGGILGLPTGEVLGFSVLLRSLVALVLGRLTNLVTVTTSAVALGVLELGIAWDSSVELIDPALGAIVLLALLLQGRRSGEGGDADGGAWRAAEEVRRLPDAVSALPVVRWGRPALLAGVVAVAAVVPHLLSSDRSLRASALLIYATLGLSLVLLSGWGGHVSLGQVAFFAVGAAVGAWATSTLGADLFAALVVAAVAGAAAATLVGVPASRARGLTLAVTTFAFSLATTSYLLGDDLNSWVPRERIERVALVGGIDALTPTAIYEVALGLLVLTALALRAIRSSRTGRAAVALRDNDRAAQSYGIDAPRLRIVTFALSGAIAAMAGALFVHHQQALDPASYGPVQNLTVFTMVVVGGLTSVTGALLGALFLLGTQWFLPADWRILASGTGVLLVLWLAPGGLATIPFGLRDRIVSRMAARRGLDIGRRRPEGTPLGPAATPLEPPPQGAGPADGLLVVQDLEASYGPVQILFGIDLHVAEGEAVALLGTNGAGKSTLLRAVSGLRRPDRGTVRFGGEDITGRPAHAIAALGLAQVPGGAGVFPSLTVAENLRAASWLLRGRPADLAEGEAEAAQLFPILAGRSSQRAGTLSGGEQQMLALAMVLLTRPRLLVVDELSLGLAPEVVGRLLAAIRALQDRGVAVLLVDQSINVALEVADRALVLERGQVRFSGPARELEQRPDLLRSVFLGNAAADDAVPAVDAADRDGGAPVPPPAVLAPQVATGDAALEARGLSVAFGGVRAVQDVSLSVAPQEIVGVIGPNGAGKTTLFDLLSGYLAADGGTVWLAGRDVSGRTPSARARLGLGRSFQDARLFPSLSVEETIATACERWVRVPDPLSAAFHLPNAQDSERAVARRVSELVELLGLGDFRLAFVRELSTGTRRVVDLACLLAHEPDVVLLDEPAAGIAQREVEALAPLIRRVRDETRASLVVIEHDIPLIRSVADRLVAMDQGRVVATGPPAEVLAVPAVVASYLGPDHAAVNRSGHVAGAPTAGR
jgi:ABC-type branched-subunit amino acid transport system ATPase component/branched-subunit amino acid ABC-type transport system permease component